MYIMLHSTMRSHPKTIIVNNQLLQCSTKPFSEAEQLAEVLSDLLCLNYMFTIENCMKPGTGCHCNVYLNQRGFASRFTGHLASTLCSSILSVISQETYIAQSCKMVHVVSEG